MAPGGLRQGLIVVREPPGLPEPREELFDARLRCKTRNALFGLGPSPWHQSCVSG